MGREVVSNIALHMEHVIPPLALLHIDAALTISRYWRPAKFDGPSCEEVPVLGFAQNWRFSKIGAPPVIIHFIDGIFDYKPSVLGFSYGFPIWFGVPPLNVSRKPPHKWVLAISLLCVSQSGSCADLCRLHLGLGAQKGRSAFSSGLGWLLWS